MVKANKPTYNWEDVTERILNFQIKLRSLINDGDRCLIFLKIDLIG